ncbi:MAG TPA: XdhC/CoxI family protein [Feifaniaceae bacterium]|nr:XdhC/CoxI family protein [Feifaniaceae bacterium]
MQRDLYQNVWDGLDAGRRSVLLTVLGKQGAEKRVFFADHDEPEQPYGALVTAAFEKSELSYLKLPDGYAAFAEPFVPEPRLIVLGGGHIALPLVEFAAKCGFSVTVADDRPAFANAPRFPLAKEVVCESFEHVFPKLRLDPYCFVVVITRGHRHDKMCLRELIKYPLAYLGMIGSKNRVRTVKESLLEEGLAQETLDKICAPIGMKIGAVTPPEIAVSILAEVILYKRTLNKEAWPELDREVLFALKEAKEVPFAIATIIEAKGSAPRGAGAKLLVWPDGRIAGSIGGGCSEGGAMKAAYEVIRTGVPCVYGVDLSGMAAEDEGMVCGGRIKVAIERYGG